MKKFKGNFKAGFNLFAVFCVLALLCSAGVGLYSFVTSDEYKNSNNNNNDNEDKLEWVLVDSFTLSPLGAIRQNVTNEASCIEFIMFYEHGNTADFSNNATVWDPDEGGYDAPHTVYGYSHTNGESNIDCDHTVSWEFACKVKLNISDVGIDATHFDLNRSRCYINMTNSGSWADGQNEAGAKYDGKIESYNQTGGDFAYLMFYWDDSGGSGYAIFANGGFTFNVNLEVKK